MNHEYALTLKNLKCMVVRKISVIVGMLRNVPRHPILLITKNVEDVLSSKREKRRRIMNTLYTTSLQINLQFTDICSLSTIINKVHGHNTW